MIFRPIDLETWPRRDVFEHYLSVIPCQYSMTVKLDITGLRKRGLPLYPTMLYALARSVNRHEEFRTAFDGAGRLGVYDRLEPSYTVFHRDSETFSCLWTEYREDYGAFCAACREDLAAYGGRQSFEGRPGTPPNVFNVSMVPWESFDSFHLHLSKGDRYLLPIFTIGKFYEAEGRVWLPLAAQVHHAVCDGFHLCRLIGEVRQWLAQPGQGGPGEAPGCGETAPGHSTAHVWAHNGYTLRPARKEDAEDYYRAGFDPLDPELARLTGSRAEYSRKEVVDFFLACVDDPDRRDFLLLDPAGHIAGEAVINEIDWESRCANFRTAIFRPEHRGMGLGTWMVRFARDFAFGELGLHRLELDVFSFNPRAIRAYEKAGFRREGARRDAVRDGDGCGDDILMAILEEEWREIAKADCGRRR